MFIFKVAVFIKRAKYEYYSSLRIFNIQAYSGSYDIFAKIFSSRLDEYQAEFTRQQKKLKDLRRQGKVSKELGKKDGGADTHAYKKQMQLVLGKVR